MPIVGVKIKCIIGSCVFFLSRSAMLTALPVEEPRRKPLPLGEVAFLEENDGEGSEVMNGSNLQGFMRGKSLHKSLFCVNINLLLLRRF